MFNVGDKVVLKDGSDNTVLHVNWSNLTHFTLQGGSEFYAVKLYTLVENMFKIGDKVKFKKSSLDSGMIDATEDDVFGVANTTETHIYLETGNAYFASWWNNGHFELVKEEIMNNAEDPEIKWQVGQEVWDFVWGKGVVVDTVLEDTYCINVKFEHGHASYTNKGKSYILHKNRSLFFSEPKIEAEKFPPKKPFIPSLKKGDTVVAKKKDGQNTTVFCVDEETELSVASTGYNYPKTAYKFYKLGEEIKFS